MEKEEVKKEKTKKGNAGKIITIVACVAIVLVIVGILIFNIVTIKTFKWEWNQPGGEGFVIKNSIVHKYRFGKPISVHSENIWDYTDAKWMDNEGIDEQVESLKNSYKESCDKYDSKCKYTVELDGRKIKVVFDRKFTKKGQKEWLEENNFDDFIELMDQREEAYNNK